MVHSMRYNSQGWWWWERFAVAHSKLVLKFVRIHCDNQEQHFRRREKQCDMQIRIFILRLQPCRPMQIRGDG